MEYIFKDMTYIYKHTNKINGKCYIGQTSNQDYHARWGKNGEGYKNQKKFYSDIEIYGWDNFEHEILVICPRRFADSYEKYFIKKYNSIENGYNILSGGSLELHIVSEENKDKKVLCIENNKIYKSIKEVSKELNLFPAYVEKVCTGAWKHTRNYHFKFVK